MSLKDIVGRTKELKFIEEIWRSKEAEFFALYGRRRVGKTHIIREYFSNKGFYFELTGLKNGTMPEQLLNFSQAFSQAFYPDLEIKSPVSWREAFTLLTKEIQKISCNKKVVIFLDELPWLASKRSKLLQNLDYFWNTQWSKMSNLKLIVSGSAASWMLDNLINAKGGLHNRLTHTLLLQPYDLSQTEQFLQSRQVKFNRKQILDLYIATGGIPYYLKQIKKSKSVTQNINDICFVPDGLLYNEFPRIFASLFENPELNLRIVREIAKLRYGITIQELSKKTGIKTGGTFTSKLNELEAAGFIQKYFPYGKSKREQYYRVIDEYSYFYLSWIEPYKEQQMIDTKATYWHSASQTPSWKSWAGYSFEGVCYKHLSHIRHALGLDNIHSCIGNWRFVPKKESPSDGAQIDLIIDRDDGVINVCEIKYSQNSFLIDKAIARNFLKKIDIYEKHFPSNKKISLVMLTTMGVKENTWSKDLIDNFITLEDLF